MFGLPGPLCPVWSLYVCAVAPSERTDGKEWKAAPQAREIGFPEMFTENEKCTGMRKS